MRDTLAISVLQRRKKVMGLNSPNNVVSNKESMNYILVY